MCSIFFVQNSSQLHGACRTGSREETAKLHDAGATENNDADMELLAAACEGKLAMVELVLQRGANINVRDRAKQTALHYASQQGRVDMVRCLLEHKADMEAKDENGRSCLDLARLTARRAVVQLLLQSASAGLTAAFPLSSFCFSCLLCDSVC
jgi:ankyrin repeat protein